MVQVASIPLFYKVVSVALVDHRGADGREAVATLGDLRIVGSIAFSLPVCLLRHELVEKPISRIMRCVVLQPSARLARE